MKNASRTLAVVSSCVLMMSASSVLPQDWPQWRGQNRDGKATGFNAPQTWPKELTQKWKVTVGLGDATPVLVGDKLYVFARQEGSEVARCLDAATGKEIWQEKYDALGATGPASGHSGPRSSPAVANGKVVTLGVRGTLSCRDAATGKTLWRKDDFQGAWPPFFTSSSPIIVDGLCIAQLGGKANSAIAAYDLTTGEPKWKWSGDGTAYASPAVMTLGGAKWVIAQTESKMVAVRPADGKLVWEVPFAVRGRGYNASTPIVDGQTMIYGGQDRGIKAVKLEKELRQHNLWVLFLHKPHSEPVISGLSNLFATANVWSPVPPEAAKLPSSRRASGGDELRASSSRRRRSLRVTDSPACCWEASFSPTDSAIEPKRKGIASLPKSFGVTRRLQRNSTRRCSRMACSLA